MKKELDEALVAKYPKIFKYRHAPMTHTAMCWGFECGSGWFHIIDALCANIQGRINQSRKERARSLRFNRALKRALNGDMCGMLRYYTYDGAVTSWAHKSIANDIERGAYREVCEAVPQVVAVQVKEKFGWLRFYVNGGDDVTYAYISMAESMSYRTCEECGTPGKIYTDGWHRVLCDAHAAEYGRNNKDNGEDNG